MLADKKRMRGVAEGEGAAEEEGETDNEGDWDKVITFDGVIIWEKEGDGVHAALAVLEIEAKGVVVDEGARDIVLPKDGASDMEADCV